MNKQNKQNPPNSWGRQQRGVYQGEEVREDEEGEEG